MKVSVSAMKNRVQFPSLVSLPTFRVSMTDSTFGVTQLADCCETRKMYIAKIEIK